MSIPDRLWRVMKGQWALASERIEERAAVADAYRELADTLRHSPPVAARQDVDRLRLPPVPLPDARGGHDPLEACYELLRLQPGADLPAVEGAYRARLAELQPEGYLPGSPERDTIEARRTAVTAAYEKLRDGLCPTRQRFDRLEF
jgi:hypothetical protein